MDYHAQCVKVGRSVDHEEDDRDDGTPPLSSSIIIIIIIMMMALTNNNYPLMGPKYIIIVGFRGLVITYSHESTQK